MCVGKKLRCVMWGVVLLVALYFGAYTLLVMHIEHRRKKALEDYLNTPIPLHVAKDLCSRGLVPERISSCTGEITIRRRDIPDIFRSRVSLQSTYEEVTQTFGKYTWYCGETKPGTLLCSYEFGIPPRMIVEYNLESGLVTFIGSGFE